MSLTKTAPVDPDFASGARLGDTKELAEALRISPSGVRKLLARGALKAVKVGGAVRYHLPSVLAQLKVKSELLRPPPVPIIERRRVVRHKRAKWKT